MSENSKLPPQSNNALEDGELSDDELSNVTGGLARFAGKLSSETKPVETSDSEGFLGLHDMMRAKNTVNNDVLKGFKD
jgi:bacteriocin-like protein